MPPGAKQLQDLAFLALVHRVRDGITAIDGVECSGDHLSKLQHDFWSSSPPSAGGRNLRRALKQFTVARNPHAGVVERRGPEQLRRHASNTDLAFMLCLLGKMASTTAFRQPNRAGRWVLSTQSGLSNFSNAALRSHQPLTGCPSPKQPLMATWQLSSSGHSSSQKTTPPMTSLQEEPP